MYLLETFYLIDLAREKRGDGGPATDLLKSLPAAEINCISTVSMAQLSVGEHLSSTAAARRRNVEFREWLSALCHILPFGLAHAAEFGKIAAEMRRKGKPIPESDIQIAATALVEGHAGHRGPQTLCFSPRIEVAFLLTRLQRFPRGFSDFRGSKNDSKRGRGFLPGLVRGGGWPSGWR